MRFASAGHVSITLMRQPVSTMRSGVAQGRLVFAAAVLVMVLIAELRSLAYNDEVCFTQRTAQGATVLWIVKACEGRLSLTRAEVTQTNPFPSAGVEAGTHWGWAHQRRTQFWNRWKFADWDNEGTVSGRIWNWGGRWHDLSLGRTTAAFDAMDRANTFITVTCGAASPIWVAVVACALFPAASLARRMIYRCVIRAPGFPVSPASREPPH